VSKIGAKSFLKKPDLPERRRVTVALTKSVSFEADPRNG
jgi:hypothetical protein